MASSLSEEQNKYLKEIYFNPKNPAAFSGLEKVWNIIKKDKKVSKKQLKQWLQTQDVYTSHVPAKRKFKRPKTISSEKDLYWQADTANMVQFEKDNDGFSYFAIFIDVFSRFIWSEKLKTLRSLEMVATLKTVFQDAKCKNLYTDAGSEYTGKPVKAFFKLENVNHFIARSDTKAAMAERAIKTIKKKLFKYMDQNNTHRWIDVLPDVVSAYNNSVHRVIKMTPSQARSVEPIDVWNNQFKSKNPQKALRTKKPTKQITYKFRINDNVKIQVKRSTFQREYDETFTPETFIITERFKKGPISLYKLKDYNNEPIVGTFQDQELVKVIIPEDKIYKIEKVLKKRKYKNKQQYLVKWKGWPKQFNSWVDDIEKL